MDSSGRIHMQEDATPDRPLTEKLYRDRLVTRFPIPELCNASKVLSALEKIQGATELPRRSDAAFASLTPFEVGYVLGVFSAAPRGEG